MSRAGEGGRLHRTEKDFLDLGAPTAQAENRCQVQIQHINENRRDHIVTIEDPVEFIHNHKNSMINQREVGSDTNSFARALKSA